MHLCYSFETIVLMFLLFIFQFVPSCWFCTVSICKFHRNQHQMKQISLQIKWTMVETNSIAYRMNYCWKVVSRLKAYSLVQGQRLKTKMSLCHAIDTSFVLPAIMPVVCPPNDQFYVCSMQHQFVLNSAHLLKAIETT